MSELPTTAMIALRLARNGLRHRYLRLVGKPGRPQAVSLEVTHHCVCRCRMCNIWTIPSTVPDLPLREWVKLLSSGLLCDLRELDITGGEPFLREDLVALVRAIAELKSTNFTGLRSVAITTNGVLADRVLTMTAEMLEPLKRSGLQLVIACALDAVGPVHDEIRRYAGAWSAAEKTIAGLLQLRQHNPDLIVGMKTTVLPQNIDALEEVADYARARDMFTIISPAIVTSGRYLNRERASDLTLSTDEKTRLARFYQDPAFSWGYHARTLARYLTTGTMKKPCSCGFNYFFVRSNGELFLCPLFGDSVGNILEHPLEELFASGEATGVRRRVGRSTICSRCTEPGLERYSLPHEGFAYLRELLELRPRLFLEQHRHLGLDKYI